MSEIKFQPIGRIRTSLRGQGGIPVQPVFGEEGEEGRIEIEPAFRAGLKDLSGFERIWVLAFLDRAGPFHMAVVPHRDIVERGLFSTRSPRRPNPIALSCLTLISVDLEAGILRTGPTDLLDGTLILDLKPYIPEIDAFPDARSGWFGA